jgi:RNA polymerase sigma-54 factor
MASNAINKRNDTMLKVGSRNHKAPSEFLEKGPQFIKPMILNDVAEAVVCMKVPSVA